MQTDHYQERLIETVTKLVDIRQQVFDLLFQVAITGELKEWSDSVPVGEFHNFTREMFEGCTDTNMQVLVKLLDNVESTVDCICNLNNIDFPIPQTDEQDD
jgi:hypothetical protein